MASIAPALPSGARRFPYSDASTRGTEAAMHDSLLARILFLGLAAAIAACGGGGDDEPDDLDVVASQPAQGIIAGSTWTIGSRSMNTDGGDLWVDLLPDVADDCTVDETDSAYPFVIFIAPAAVGTYPLGDTQTVTFVDAPSSNLIVTRGV